MSEEAIRELLEQLRVCGVQADLGGIEGAGIAAMKMVCVPSSLSEGLSELDQSARDQVVMLRADADTVKKLDAWVETGAIKSRSQAAALFIREGLRVRDDELSELEEALDDVNKAKARLRERAKEVLGSEDAPSD